jgi:hypothetical protein
MVEVGEDVDHSDNIYFAPGDGGSTWSTLTATTPRPRP